MEAEVVVLLQSNRNNDAPWTTVAVGTDAHIPLPFNGRSAWLQRLAKEDRAYLAQEMFALPEWQYAPTIVRGQIEGLGIKVFVPLHCREELTGLLLLGAKTSGRAYSLEEIDLLEAVALHAAATMESARLYQELRLQLKELKETQAQLVQSGKLASVGTLAAGVAHEVNNPVFAISGMTELLLSNPERYLKSPQAEECLTVIAEMSHRIAKVVQGILVYSRNDQTPSLVDLNQVADDTLRLVEHKLRSGGINVARSYHPDLPPAKAVANRLQQALMNLILNANDAMGNSGTLTLSTGVCDSRVWLSCADTGSGIPKEILDHIFDAFFTTKPVGKGTGLGLHITYRIIEDCGGEIQVQSQPGLGTTFTLYLPVANPEDKELESEDLLLSPEEIEQPVHSGSE
jgi:signal transduction histidine kinase